MDYLYKRCVEPLHTDYKNPFDIQPIREKYINTPHEFDPLRETINSSVERVLNFLNKDHPIQLLIDGSTLNVSLNYQIIQKKKITLSLDLKTPIYPIVYEKKPTVIRNLDVNDISSVFIGMFEDDVRHGTENITVPFRINTPHIFCRLK